MEVEWCGPTRTFQHKMCSQDMLAHYTGDGGQVVWTHTYLPTQGVLTRHASTLHWWWRSSGVTPHVPSNTRCVHKCVCHFNHTVQKNVTTEYSCNLVTVHRTVAVRNHSNSYDPLQLLTPHTHTHTHTHTPHTHHTHTHTTPHPHTHTHACTLESQYDINTSYYSTNNNWDEPDCRWRGRQVHDWCLQLVEWLLRSYSVYPTPTTTTTRGPETLSAALPVRVPWETGWNRNGSNATTCI